MCMDKEKHIIARLHKTRELVRTAEGISEQINKLTRELRDIKSHIKTLCPHYSVERVREHDGHRAIYFYECPVCKRDIGYDAYREYLKRID